MEKYAVVEDGEKTADTEPLKKACPNCGRVLKEDVNVRLCEACGTKPFEPSEAP